MDHRHNDFSHPPYNWHMADAKSTLERYFPEMRWRCLSLAADLDRLDRAGGSDDERLDQLREAMKVLLSNQADRAARVQMILSDQTPPPAR
jgi:hypothetical protein